MADTKKKWVSKDNLVYYDGKIKAFAQGIADKVKSDIINGAPEAYDTLKEISGYISTHTSEYEALVTLVGDKATKAELNAEIAKITALQTAVATLNDDENNADSVDGKVKALKDEITEALNKATSAVQSVATGSANGTIAVDGTDVAVKGLGSSAYENTDAFDAAGTATTKVNELANGAVATNTSAIATLNGEVTDDGSVKKIAKGYADAAQTAAESAVTILQNGQVATNASDIATLQGKVAALESAEPEAVTTAEIDEMFATPAQGE